MRNRRLARLKNQRGILLISSYLILAALFLYSNMMVVRSLNQRISNDQLHSQLQGVDLSQAAAEALREELYQFLTTDIYQNTYSSDPRQALAWLDSLDDATLPAGMRAFDPNRDSIRDGSYRHPLCVASLPTAQGATTKTTKQVCTTTGSGKTTVTTCQNVSVVTPVECENKPDQLEIAMPHAWITKVEDLGEDANGDGTCTVEEDLNKDGKCYRPYITSPNQSYQDFYPRRVTIRGAARGLSGLLRSVQAQAIFALNASSIFRYGYFINNFGWLDPGSRQWTINADVRSNGNLLFGATAPTNLKLQGDIFASANPGLQDPITLMPAQGTISGTTGYLDDPEAYFNQKSTAGRPNRLLSLPSTDTVKRPSIEALYGWWMPTGWGWDTLDGYAPQYYSGQKPHDLPYIGDLELYRQRAQTENSSLRGRNQFGQLQTISQAYNSTEPLVLIGTAASPIVIDGPVVVPGDVILRGVVSGQGTIYAGRNIHIVGELTYQAPWRMPRLQRNQSTGALRVLEDGMAVGTVCDNGRYVAPGDTVPANCMQAPSGGWVPYGYAVPGYGAMGFSKVSAFTNKYKTAGFADSLGLSAKGNIIVGDYTAQNFKDNVKPRLQDITQPYVIDPTDEALGYRDYDNAQGTPVFNGNYDRRDWEVNAQGQLVQGTKADGTPRKFYESSVSNATLHQMSGVWQPIVDPTDPLYNTQDKARIDAVLYANHLIAGYVPDKGTQRLELNGTMVARDDGLVIDSNFTLNHDNRLDMGSPAANGSAWLPVTISRPVLSRWQECTTTNPCP